jgi:hypothetical protein
MLVNRIFTCLSQNPVNELIRYAYSVIAYLKPIGGVKVIVDFDL